MRHMIVPVLACALLAGAAFADDPPSSTSTPDATLNLSGGTFALGVGVVWGSGDLTYKGQTHPFKLSGVSIVDVGGSHLTASGEVYNLTTLKDFDGNYTAASAGLTVAGGGSAAILRNEHGVVIKLLSTTEGLRFNLAAEGVNIKLTT